MKPLDCKEVRTHNRKVKKHAKEKRRMLKNRGMKVSAQMIALS